MTAKNNQVVLESTRKVVDNASLDEPPTYDLAVRPDAIGIELLKNDVLELWFMAHREMLANSKLGTQYATLPSKPNEVTSAVQECLSAWQRVVDFALEYENGTPYYPFQEHVDLRSRPEYLRKLGPGLARAGANLYKTLFGNPGTPSRLSRLVQHVAGRGNHFTIMSNCLFVPWPLIYSNPDGTKPDPSGKDWVPEGFWGVRHTLDHRVKENDHYGNVEYAAEQLRVSLNYDPGIDAARDHPVVANIRKFFEPRVAPCNLVERTTTPLLIDSLKTGSISEQIAYFCCHQDNQDPPSIIFDDHNDPFTASALRDAAEHGHPDGFGDALFVFF